MGKKRFFSIRIKMYIFVFLATFTVVFGVSMIAYKTSAKSIDDYYKQASSNNAKNVASSVDGDFLAEFGKVLATDEYQQLREKAEEEDDEQAIEDYLKEKGVWDKFSEIRGYISKYLRNISDMKYIYIVADTDKDATEDMYLITDDTGELYETGYIEEREAELCGYDLEDMPEPTISNGVWGWLCSDFKPVHDKNGDCVAIVGCDYAMDDVMNERYTMLISIIIGSLLFSVTVLAGSVLFINLVVVGPLDKITAEMKHFTPSEHMSYEEAGVIELKIKSHDEINEIYQGIRSMQINIIDYLNDMSVLMEDKQKAERDIEDKDRQIGRLSEQTYKDALTSVGNKSAYIKKVDELNAAINDGSAEFALVMIDLNHLKQVNDDYGHKAGDQYIIGSCRMACEAFKHSPVYRIGGDEFVVILQGADYNDRREIFDKLKAGFAESYSRTDADPWCRYSAALGMAEKASDDSTAELVFRRADKAMYNDKMAFKNKYGSYR